MKKADKKPTIKELEDILDEKGNNSIEILPNGEIRAKTRISELEEEGKQFKKELGCQADCIIDEGGNVPIYCSEIESCREPQRLPKIISELNLALRIAAKDGHCPHEFSKKCGFSRSRAPKCSQEQFEDCLYNNYLTQAQEQIENQEPSK